MQNEKHETHDKQEVDQTGTDVKCEKPKQPKNNQTKAINPSMSTSPSLPSGKIKSFPLLQREEFPSGMSLGVSAKAGMSHLRHCCRADRFASKTGSPKEESSRGRRGISGHRWKKSRANVRGKPETKKAADFSAA